jgi:hypothetical protein
MLARGATPSKVLMATASVPLSSTKLSSRRPMMTPSTLALLSMPRCVRTPLGASPVFCNKVDAHQKAISGVRILL